MYDIGASIFSRKHRTYSETEALKILAPGLPRKDALVHFHCSRLNDRRVVICRTFIKKTVNGRPDKG